MVSEDRRDYLDYLWGEETSDPATWEWRDDLNAEELALVESWDALYANSVRKISEDILARSEGR